MICGSAQAQEQHKFSNPFTVDDYEYVLPGLCHDAKLTVVGLTDWGTFCDAAVPQVAAQRAARDAMRVNQDKLESADKPKQE
jgi:hypothetical protein